MNVNLLSQQVDFFSTEALIILVQCETLYVLHYSDGSFVGKAEVFHISRVL